MRVCLLNSSEAKQLENENRTPSCANHAHLPFGEVTDGVAADKLRWVEAPSAIAGTRRRAVETTVFLGYEPRVSSVRGHGGRIEARVATMQAVTQFSRGRRAR